MRVTIALAAAVVLLSAGCSHPMVISPSLANIKPNESGQTINKNVGYYMSPGMRSLQTKSDGGSGDSIVYKPYQDIETGLYKMLSNVFADVTRLNSPADKAELASRKIDYVIVPTLSTRSSSTNALVWMPGKFGVDMTLAISDTNGNPVTSVTAKGEGSAKIGETTRDLSVAGVRASEDVLNKMQQTLLESPQLRSTGQ